MLQRDIEAALRGAAGPPHVVEDVSRLGEQNRDGTTGGLRRSMHHDVVKIAQLVQGSASLDVVRSAAGCKPNIVWTGRGVGVQEPKEIDELDAMTNVRKQLTPPRGGRVPGAVAAATLRVKRDGKRVRMWDGISQHRVHHYGS